MRTRSVSCSVAGVSSLTGWLRAQPSATKELRNGVACLDDVLELRATAECCELVASVQWQGSEEDFRRAKLRAIDAVMQCVSSEAPPPSRLPRPAALIGAGSDALTIEWRIDESEVEDLGWALVAMLERASGDKLRALDARATGDGGFVCSLLCGSEFRLAYEGSQGSAMFSTRARSSTFESVLHSLANEALSVPIIERCGHTRASAAYNRRAHRQPTAGSAWAAAIVDELVRCGVDRFVVCPGSRSTPLALAASRELLASARHTTQTRRTSHQSKVLGEKTSTFVRILHAMLRS